MKQMVIQCPGFKAAGIAAGIKKNNALDLGLIYSEKPAAVAGLFTRNCVQAAPVILTKAYCRDGKAQAIVVNSGNANCCNGFNAMMHTRIMAADVANALQLAESDVLVGSTGVIGAPLPIERIQATLPDLIANLQPDRFDAFARAIMTTDTVPKLVQQKGRINGHGVTIAGVAKGAGMIRPDMATMLCFICTDAAISAPLLQQMLKRATDQTLNRITIDGDTSTNDMVLALANGVCPVKIESVEQQTLFQAMLDKVLMVLARWLVKDGEGVTKVVEIKVQGAGTETDAMQIADTVAHSPLVKTAFFGQDANWGRILAAVGRSGVTLDPERIDIFFDAAQMVRQGQGCGQAAEEQVTEVLKQPEFSVTIDLHQGQAAAFIITSDLSVDYVKINADYRT